MDEPKRVAYATPQRYGQVAKQFMMLAKHYKLGYEIVIHPVEELKTIKNLANDMKETLEELCYCDGVEKCNPCNVVDNYNDYVSGVNYGPQTIKKS